MHAVGLLLGGLLRYDLEELDVVLATWPGVMADAPDEIALFAMVSRSAIDGPSGVVISVAYFGDAGEGRDALQPPLDVGPETDGVRPMYYAELQEMFARMPFGLRYYWSGRFLRELPDAAIELTATHFDDPDATGSVLLEPLNGADARVPVEATAFARREAKYNVTFSSIWTDPAGDERQVAQARAYSAACALIDRRWLRDLRERAGR